MYCDKSISVEPRLIEYIEHMVHNKKNNIFPSVPLHIKYAITSDDLQKIEAYVNQTKSPISSNLHENDEIYYPPKIQYKMKLHYDKLEKRRCEQRTKLPHTPNYEHVMKYVDKHTNFPAYMTSVFGSPPLHGAPNINLSKSNRVYDDRTTNDCINKIREQYFNNQKLDSDIMTDIMLGIPSHTGKSYGYNDPFEHSFDYIDNDIQDPNHVILPFPRGGTSARLANKKRVPRDIIV